MIETLDSQAVRDAEEPLLAAGVPLMERAAWGLAGHVLRLLRARGGPVASARVVLLVGTGNNGGDALLAGARLRGRGVAVTALLFGDEAHPAGLQALRDAGGTTTRVTEDEVPELVRRATAAQVVVDGIVGIGSTGGLRAPAASFVEALTAAWEPLPTRPLVVAVDLPSGIGADDGTLPPSALGRSVVLPAECTVTFGAPKPGLLLPPAASLVGRIEVVDLGLPAPRGTFRPGTVRRLGTEDVVGLLGAPATSAHKYTRGVLGVVAGTQRFPGAAVLCVSGAVHTGVGMVRFLGDPAVGAAVLAARPEAVPIGGQVQAWALGSGIPFAPSSSDDEARAQRSKVRQALAQVTGELSSDVVGPVVPAVVDAGGLSVLPPVCPPWVVLTPHAGELAELLRSRGDDVERAEVEAEPLRWATRARDLTGATVLLKGAVTVVVGPSGVFSQAEAPSWLATAGAGDVLTGLLGALLASHAAAAVKDPGLPAVLAAAAALVHGRAAHRANPGGPVAALAVAEAIPATIAALLRGDHV